MARPESSEAEAPARLDVDLRPELLSEFYFEAYNHVVLLPEVQELIMAQFRILAVHHALSAKRNGRMSAGVEEEELEDSTKHMEVEESLTESKGRTGSCAEVLEEAHVKIHDIIDVLKSSKRSGETSKCMQKPELDDLRAAKREDVNMIFPEQHLNMLQSFLRPSSQEQAASVSGQSPSTLLDRALPSDQDAANDASNGDAISTVTNAVVVTPDGKPCAAPKLISNVILLLIDEIMQSHLSEVQHEIAYQKQLIAAIQPAEGKRNCAGKSGTGHRRPCFECHGTNKNRFSFEAPTPDGDQVLAQLTGSNLSNEAITGNRLTSDQKQQLLSGFGECQASYPDVSVSAHKPMAHAPTEESMQPEEAFLLDYATVTHHSAVISPSEFSSSLSATPPPVCDQQDDNGEPYTDEVFPEFFNTLSDHDLHDSPGQTVSDEAEDRKFQELTLVSSQENAVSSFCQALPQLKTSTCPAALSSFQYASTAMDATPASSLPQVSPASYDFHNSFWAGALRSVDPYSSTDGLSLISVRPTFVSVDPATPICQNETVFLDRFVAGCASAHAPPPGLSEATLLPPPTTTLRKSLVTPPSPAVFSLCASLLDSSTSLPTPQHAVSATSPTSFLPAF